MQHTNKSGTLNRGLKRTTYYFNVTGLSYWRWAILGSASAIKLAGPSILLGYMIAGLVIFHYASAWGNGN